MMNDDRIKEAETNFERYLEDGLIKKTSNDFAQKIFVKNANDSLKAAQLMLENKITLWTIVSSYYAMFYMANAVLLKLGYKTGDRIVHKVTSDALIFIIRPKLKKQILDNYEEIKEQALQLAEIKSDEIVLNFDYERNKRNTIQYQTTNLDMTNKARTSLERAKEFLFEMEKLLG